MSGHGRHALALDVGGSHVTAALVSLHHRTVVEASLERRAVDPDGSADALLGAWTEVALAALERAGGLEPERVGVAMPGPFEYDAGVARLTRKFASLCGVNVGEALRDRWAGQPLDGAPLRFGNDATLFALGECWAGSARGAGRVVGVTLGTGLGGGFVANGEPLYRGEGVPENGAVWHLPLRGGIAEDFVCGPALTRAYAARTGRSADPSTIAEVARAGDPDANAVYLELGRNLAAALAPWLAAFWAEVLVVGGNVARAWPLFREPLGAGLADLPVAVVRTELFEAASLLGAAALGTSESTDPRLAEEGQRQLVKSPAGSGLKG